VVDAVY